MADVARYGYLGVEFFFIISGYVIFYTASGKTPGQFATSRAVRLYPAFWAAVLFTACFAWFWGGPLMGVTVPQVLANLTMVPSLLRVNPADGVYWTLYIELTFYVAVLSLLMARQQGRLERFALWWPVAMLLATVAGWGHYAFLGGYYAFFAAGAIFAMLRTQVLAPRVKMWGYVSLLIAFTLCVLGTIERAPNHNPAILGLIITAQFAFFFAQNTPQGLALRLPGSRLAGGLTYPIYLVHAHVGYMLLSRFATDANRAWVYPLVAAFVIAAAWAIHELVEERLGGFWHGLFQRWLGRPMDAFWSHLWSAVTRA